MNGEFLTIILTGLLASLPGLILWYSSRKKQSADAAQSIVDASATIVTNLTDQLERAESKSIILTGRLDLLSQRIAKLLVRIGGYEASMDTLATIFDKLIKQIRSLDADPCINDDDWKNILPLLRRTSESEDDQEMQR